MYGTVSILNYALILYSTVYLRLTIVNTTVLSTLVPWLPGVLTRILYAINLSIVYH